MNHHRARFAPEVRQYLHLAMAGWPASLAYAVAHGEPCPCVSVMLPSGEKIALDPARHRVAADGKNRVTLADGDGPAVAIYPAPVAEEATA